MRVRNLFTGRFETIPGECPECIFERKHGRVASAAHTCDPLTFGHSTNCPMDDRCRCTPLPKHEDF